MALCPWSAATRAMAQALPAAEASPISTGFTIPTFGGSLNWAVSASESLNWGYYSTSNVGLSSNISGDVAYLSTSRYHPFSMVLAAGHGFGTSHQPSYNFTSLGLSQVVNKGRWNFVLSDSVSYLPETATTGLSGVAGVGDLGVPPIQVGPEAGQGLLTNYSPEVTNSTGASLARQVTGKTSLNWSGSYSILRFVNGAGSNNGGYGLESDSITGSAGFSHQLSARNTYGANYAYTSNIFLNNRTVGIPAPNFVSQTGSFTFSHQVSRRLSFNVAAGPEWVRINNSQSIGQSTTSVTAYAQASANYANEFSRMSLGYVRSTNSGWGVTGGSRSDSVTFSASRIYARVWNTSSSVAWSHTTNLPSLVTLPYNFTTVVAGFQASRALARNLSGFASYTVELQSHQSSAAAIDLFDGVNQIFSFGVTYSPVARQFGRP